MDTNSDPNGDVNGPDATLSPTPTGRRIPGPGSDLIEVEIEGLNHTSIAFGPALRGHPCLNAGLEHAMGFMAAPDVTGLVRLRGQDVDDGGFLYPTGTVWSVAELIRELAGAGEIGGVKAGLELCYLAGEILVEAADKESHSNLAGHGGIDPWRLMLKPDGQVTIVGYGLPRAELALLFEDDTLTPSEDTLRYCAPEDLIPDGPRDLSADLYSLSLVALELMVGKPVYGGLASSIRTAASRGEAGRRLYQWRDKVPDAVRQVLGRALKPDRDTRFRDGLDFVYGVHDLLGGIDAGDGPSLRELVSMVRARQKRGKAVVGGQTGALSREEMAALAADIDNEGVPTRIPQPRKDRPEEESEAETPDDAPRWSRASRRAEPEATSSRRGRRARSRSTADTSGDGDSARERLLRRLRDRTEPPSPPAVPRRRSRSGERQSTEEVAGREEAEPAPEPAEPSRRRRGGRGAALLERLRSASGNTNPPEAPPSLPRAAEAKPAAAEPAPAPAPPPEADADATPAAPPKRRATPLGAATEEGQVRISYEGRVAAVEGPGVAWVANFAAQELGLRSTGAFGTRECAWWLSVDGAPLGVDAVLPAEAQLVRVPNQARTLVFEYGGTSIPMVVGAALRVGELATVVAERFGLVGRVGLWAGDRELGAAQLVSHLGDRPLEVRQ